MQPAARHHDVSLQVEPGIKVVGHLLRKLWTGRAASLLSHETGQGPRIDALQVSGPVQSRAQQIHHALAQVLVLLPAADRERKDGQGLG